MSMFLVPGGRARSPSRPWLPCLLCPFCAMLCPPHPFGPAPMHIVLSAIPLLPAPWDPNGFHRGPPRPPPPLEWGARQGGTWPPHCSPRSKATMFLPSRCVSPASSLPLLSAALLLLVPLSTLQPLHSSPTNLSRPLSSSPSFLPPASHRDVPGPATGPLRVSLTLCL